MNEPMGASLVPVEVVEDDADSVGIAIVSPSGFRLEGLDVVSATAVLRALR